MIDITQSDACESAFLSSLASTPSPMREQRGSDVFFSPAPRCPCSYRRSLLSGPHSDQSIKLILSYLSFNDTRPNLYSS